MRHWVPLRSCLSGFTFIVQLVGQNTFFNAYFWTRVVGFILLPSLLLICLNALLIKLIRKAQRRKERLLREKRAREAQRQTDSNSTSIMLVIIVSIFLIVNLPTALFMAMLCVYNTLGLSNRFLEGLFPVTFLLVNNMLVMATYPINFGIYCFMSSSFRDTFWMLFCRRKNCADADRIKSKRMDGGASEMNNTLFTTVRRSTDPSLDKASKAPLTKRPSQPACRSSTDSSFSLLSEPLLDTPQPNVIAINGSIPNKMKTYICEEGEGNRQRGQKKCKANSPTETILGETIFL
uniref:G_PROTEIN_RECEP_F1_2 domain-containing protein n=1 Tax=Globodera pallida TaxID=36090 RepID=A0A183BKZ8_GLOPA